MAEQWHLEELRNALTQKGWNIIEEREDTDPVTGLPDSWTIQRSTKRPVQVLGEVMTEYTILDDTSIKNVRRWGYDLNLFLCEQDEDLVVGDVAYLPVLFELACDPQCPKAEYCLTIIDFHATHWFLYRDSARTGAVVRAAADASEKIVHAHSSVAEWVHEYTGLYQRLLHPQSFSEQEAERFARRLIEYGRRFRKTGRIITGCTEFCASTESFECYLYVCQKTGMWEYSVHAPIDEVRQHGVCRIIGGR